MWAWQKVEAAYCCVYDLGATPAPMLISSIGVPLHFLSWDKLKKATPQCESVMLLALDWVKVISWNCGYGTGWNSVIHFIFEQFTSRYVPWFNKCHVKHRWCMLVYFDNCQEWCAVCCIFFPFVPVCNNCFYLQFLVQWRRDLMALATHPQVKVKSYFV